MKKPLALILACVVLVLLGIVLWLVRSSPDAPEIDADHSSQWAPRPWPLDDAKHVPIDPLNGPRFRVSASSMIEMTPHIPGVQLAWRVEEDSDHHIMLGTGELDGATVDARWDFASGNPQAFLSVVIKGVRPAQILEPIVASLSLPPGEVRFVDENLKIRGLAEESQTISGWNPGWLRWTESATTQSIQLSQWWADDVRLVQSDTGVSVEFSLFTPELRHDSECEEPVDIEFRLVFSVEALPAVFPARLADGARAALVPIFVAPDANPVPSKSLRPKSAQKWVAQARTLAMGHSDPNDPRYGNGGFLGARMGATFVYPHEFASASEIGAFESDLVGTGFELRQGGSEIFGKPECGALHPLWIREGDQSEGGFQNLFSSAFRSAFAGPAAQSVRIPVLDGTRSQLTAQSMSRLYLARLVRERGMSAFAAPLVASRNPLLPGANESLLVPERGGQWTLEPELVKAFADLDLWREENTGLSVMALGDVVERWRQIRGCSFEVSPSGGAWVDCETLAGVTLIFEGERVFSESSLPRVVNDADRRAQTWTWFDTTGEPLVIESTVEHPPRAVEWVFPD